MFRLLQRCLAPVTTTHNAIMHRLCKVQNSFRNVVSSTKLYVNPTLCRRLGVAIYGNGQFAYQKAESRFDNYPIRAIIRDERF